MDLTSGLIWAELNDQVESWINRANEYGITKQVLYLSALEEGERIDPERIQRRLAIHTTGRVRGSAVRYPTARPRGVLSAMTMSKTK